MKIICRMVFAFVLGSVLFAGNFNLWAQKVRDILSQDKLASIGVTANLGLGRLADIDGAKSVEVDPIRLGVSYVHPLNEMFSVGGFAELRLSFTRLRYSLKSSLVKKGF